MARKKMRRSASMQSSSPVVSDDDGIEMGFAPQSGKSNFSNDGIELISGGESSDESVANVADNFVAGEESDSSSDGDANPVGEIPMRWYEGYDHIGYNQEGEKILPKNRPSALELAADKSAWRRIYDEKNDEEIVLSHQELKEIARMRAGRYPAGDVDTENEVVAWSGPVVKHPLTSGTEPKRRFLPSRHEARLVVKLVRGMRAGHVKRPSEIAAQRRQNEVPYQYDVWSAHEPKTREEMSKSERARDIMRVPAPKPPLPKHAESYNPPAEYLPTEEESKEWNELDPEERATNYLPTKHSSLRAVPLYENFIKERFERCLDLYLAVRVIKDQKRILNPDDLVPDLPSPRDLRPFPTDVVSTFGPLPSRARGIDVHPKGQWLLSGSDDGCVRLWDIITGHVQNTWNFGKLVKKIDNLQPPISSVAWSPREDAYVFAVTIGYSLIVVGAASAMGVTTDETDMALEHINGTGDLNSDENMQKSGIVWTERNFNSETDGENSEGNTVEKNDEEENASSEEDENIKDSKDVENSEHETRESKCPMILISHSRTLKTFCWHRKGDYIATAGKDGSGSIVAIHRLTHRSSQLPFKKKTARVQVVKFHPTRPFFLVATTQHVRIYNLALQQMVKTLKPGVTWISSIDVHPSGDHVLVTSYDKRLCWFDLDLSIRPYKIVRNHDKAVRIAKYHPRLPLFADGADDGSSHVFHGMVYDDLNKNALIVPVKKLEKCSVQVDSLGVLDIAWHPRLPWLFTSGADRTIKLLTDCSQG